MNFNKNISFKLKFCVFIVLNLLNFSDTQDACETYDEQSGVCIILNHCSIYYDMIKFAILTPDQLALISRNWCGTVEGQEKVCCPKIETVESTQRPTIEQKVEPEITKLTVSQRKFIETTSSSAVELSGSDYSNHRNIKFLDQQMCGNIIDNKISNGNLTELFEFPWMAIIQYQTDDGIEPLCGGTVISKKYILTAAHCITMLRRGFSVHSVVLGEQNTIELIDCVKNNPEICAEQVQIILIDKLIVHPQYNRRNFLNDIGLIRLIRDIDFSSKSVRPICLPLTPTTQISLPSVKVTGWGRTEYGVSSTILLQANMKVINNTYCRNLYKERIGISIMETHLCAGDPSSDNCRGDSGGPAIYSGNTRLGLRYMQYGIVSAGINMCGVNRGLPVLFTRVTSYIKWILDNIDT